jgi:hypothetical protein
MPGSIAQQKKGMLGFAQRSLLDCIPLSKIK